MVQNSINITERNFGEEIPYNNLEDEDGWEGMSYRILRSQIVVKVAGLNWINVMSCGIICFRYF
jgi:hypothetical protein